MKLTKGMFIEVDYTGKLETGDVFDTTLPDVAKKTNLKKGSFKPRIICLGEKHLLPGLDEHLIGKELGSYTVALPAEKAFGKKDTKLVQLIPAQKFKDAKINPFIGLEVNIDDHYGIVRSISGGRVTVDFNHPLAGKDLNYDVTVNRVIENPEEKVSALVDLFGLHHHGVIMEGPDHAVIKVHSMLPQPVAETINGIITKLTGVKTITYHVEKGAHQ